MKREYLLLCFVIMLVSLSVVNTSATFLDDGTLNQNVSDCGTLSTANAVYTLNTSVTTTGTCLTITASNITVNGNGFSITGDGTATDYGITTPTNSNLINITIQNFGNINNFTRGIFLDQVNNSLIYNNIMISQVAQTTFAIYLEDGNSNIVYNNNINWNATSSNKDSLGVYLFVSSGKVYGNNNITENNLSIYSQLHSGYGFLLVNSGTSNSNTIQSNTIDVNVLSSSVLLSSIGVYLNNYGTSNSNTIQSNTIDVTASGSSLGQGFFLYNEVAGTSNSNTIQSNTIDVNASGIGVHLYNFGTSMNSNTIYNQTINVYSSASASAFRSYGVTLYNADYSNVSLLRINASAPNALASDVYLSSGSSGNVFRDMNLLGANWSSYIVNSGGTNNTFTNVSYNGGEYVGTSSELIRKWYYSAYVNDTLGNNVSNANVTAYNVTGTYNFNLTTDNTGYTSQTEIIDYINSGTRTYYSPYTIYVSNDSYPLTFKSYNVTTQQNNLNDIITMGTLNSCGNLVTANSVYTLLNNVTSTDTCFNIQSSNITLDCQGYEINYSSNGGSNEYGVYSTYNFTTIKNCIIKEGATAGNKKYAIYFIGASNGTINNNTITTLGTSGYGISLSSNSSSNILSNNTITTSNSNSIGIYLNSSSTNTLSGNIIATYGMSGYGIYLRSSLANTISNNTITTSGEYGNGIYLWSNSNSNTLSNNTITTLGIDDSYGIWLSSSSINTLSNNTITTSGEYSYGIWVYSSSTNTISDNTITTLEYSGNGIYLESSSNSNILSNNTITTSGIYGYGISLKSSTNNNSFSGINIKTSGSSGYAFYIYNTNHNFTIRDSILNSSKLPGLPELYIASAVSGGEWNFTNVTRANGNPINVYWAPSAGGNLANGTLNMKWYFNAQVNYTHNNLPVNNAYVLGYNVSGSLIDNKTTNAQGKAILTLIEYVNKNGNKSYYSNYTINVTKIGWKTNSTSYNVTGNTGSFFFLYKTTCHQKKFKLCFRKKCHIITIKVCR